MTRKDSFLLYLMDDVWSFFYVQVFSQGYLYSSNDRRRRIDRSKVAGVETSSFMSGVSWDLSLNRGSWLCGVTQGTDVGTVVVTVSLVLRTQES